MLVSLAVLTGLVYPLAVTAAARLLFPFQADGSLIKNHGQVPGSRLIGQPFDDPGYFWPRPSATSPFPYNAAASSGSNDGPLSENLRKTVEASIEALRRADPENRRPIPVDLVTTSASGLDPHITPEAALYQVSRVARARRIDPAKVRALIQEHTEGRQLGFLGEPTVNVLELNLALQKMR